MKTQLQMFYDEQRKIADKNNIFLMCVKEGMTKRELQILIDKRPELWQGFSNWLDKLPEWKGIRMKYKVVVEKRMYSTATVEVDCDNSTQAQELVDNQIVTGVLSMSMLEWDESQYEDCSFQVLEVELDWQILNSVQ